MTAQSPDKSMVRSAVRQTGPNNSKDGPILLAPWRHWSADQLLDYFRQRRQVVYDAAIDRELTATDKIVGILKNRFDFLGESHTLTSPIDWHNNPSDDLEWLILLHKFYYGVGLGMEYQQSGQTAFCEKWMELVASWIDQVPLSFLSSDVIGRRVQNWIFALRYFLPADGRAMSPIDPHFFCRLLRSIHHQVTHLCSHLTPARNHRTIELYTIFLASVVFPEFASAAQWHRFAIDELTKNIVTDFRTDGVHCEQSTDYHHLVLKNYLGIKQLACKNGIQLPAAIDEGICRAAEFAAFVHKPDGAIPSLSDGDSRSFLDLLLQAHLLFGNENWLYVATRGKEGRAPDCRSRLFSDSGYCIMRSGWGSHEPFADERYLVFDCGPLGAGNHGHFDWLHFEMAAFGRSLVVDPGRFTYQESAATNWRAIFRGTAYHNTVLVDGRDQIRYVSKGARYKVDGPEPDYLLRHFVSDPQFDYVCGTCRSHEYDVLHERQIFFVAPEYWLVMDHLTSASEHTYDLLFHLSDEAQGRTEVRRCEFTVVFDAPSLVIAQPADQGECEIDSGYISRSYGTKSLAPIARRRQRARCAEYLSVLYPYREERPEVQLERISAPAIDRWTCHGDRSAKHAWNIRVSAGGREFVDQIRYHGQRPRGDNGSDSPATSVIFHFVRTDSHGQQVREHCLSIAGACV